MCAIFFFFCTLSKPDRQRPHAQVVARPQCSAPDGAPADAEAPQGPEAVVLAGNSLGGYASLVAAARHPELVRGLMLLNSAGVAVAPHALGGCSPR